MINMFKKQQLTIAKHHLQNAPKNERTFITNFQLKTNFTNYFPKLIPDDVMGFIKFIDPPYWEDAKHGQLHFSDPSAFIQAEDKAKKDNEGTAINIKVKGYKSLEKLPSVNIKPALKIRFKPKHKARYASIYPKDVYMHDISTSMQQFRQRTLLLEQLQNDYDLFIKPTEYCISDLKNEIRVTKANVLFHEHSKYNGLILSLVMVKKSDLNSQGRLSQGFIQDILDRDKSTNSIAFNNSEPRPWIWISKEELLNMIKQTSQYDLVANPVRYYNARYPFSFNQLRFFPGLNLFAKKDTFKSQREYRLLYGGPNEDFTSIDVDQNNNYHFDFHNINYGRLNELENLKILI